MGTIASSDFLEQESGSPLVSRERVEEEILDALRRNNGLLAGKKLISDTASALGVDKNEVRRAILQLNVEGVTAYTSEWDVLLASPTAVAFE